MPGQVLGILRWVYGRKIVEILTVRDSFLSPKFFPFGLGHGILKPTSQELTRSYLLCFLLSYVFPLAPGQRHSVILYAPTGQMRTEAQRERGFPSTPGPGVSSVAQSARCSLVA